MWVGLEGCGDDGRGKPHQVEGVLESRREAEASKGMEDFDKASVRSGSVGKESSPLLPALRPPRMIQEVWEANTVARVDLLKTRLEMESA